ncbi:hypothetical protein COU59_03305 [Candidatus Pacearchaeota archaeon CG10_big_fil_rev_8_21_14_0_10_34_12]|nr:MAG: hypothetical protein COU59_03305 [Candidatus Pacearchaeota archaeon CG10_big_fil_rev_8_21_14_0_10_34_12]
MKNPKYIVLLALILISLISSIMLVVYDFKPLPQICAPGEGCYAVKNSQYNELFLGIPNEYLGTGFFLALFILILSQMSKPKKRKHLFILLGISLASIFTFYSLYIQVILLNAYCKYCMIMDLSILIALAFIIIFRK